MAKPIVRLDPGGDDKRPRRKTAVVESEIQKLAIRLTEGVNEALRTLIRYRGDLSAMAIEALESTDLAKVALVSKEEPMVRDTTISLPRPLHRKLQKIAKDRGSSMNIVVNTGLAYWLAEKGNIQLR
jgi:hypothetical protein